MSVEHQKGLNFSESIQFYVAAGALCMLDMAGRAVDFVQSSYTKAKFGLSGTDYIEQEVANEHGLSFQKTVIIPIPDKDNHHI